MRKVKRGSATTIKEVALANLGVKSTAEINEWFTRSYAGDYRIDGLDEAIDLLDSRKWDLVQVVGDYDIDGCTATAQLRLVLSALGYPVRDRIPKRFSEGFGLNPKIVEEISETGNILLITCDNGIAAIDAVKMAKGRGYTVIITDHHLPIVQDGKIVLPEADLIIDPNAISGSADFNGYCGSGIVYRLLTRLLDRKMQGKPEDEVKNLKNLKAVLQPLAMMGTIGDVMELREENYVIARNGLSKLEKRVATPGMMALHDALWITSPTAADIGFKSGPCINANGRLYDDGAAKSVNLLSEMSYAEGQTMARDAIANNNTRKQQVADGMKIAEQYILANGYSDDLPLVVYLPGVNEGIIGIIAGKLQESHRTVAMVFTDSEIPGVLKGSGRSADDIDLKAMLDELSEYFVKYGGHEGAAGMSIEKTKLNAMREAGNELAKKRGIVKAADSVLEYDLEIDASQLENAIEESLQFAPFGQGNNPIVFKVRGFKLSPGPDGKMKSLLGTEGVKIFHDNVQAVSFNLASSIVPSQALSLTLYGTLAYSYFKGEKTVTVEIMDFDEEDAPVSSQTPLMQALKKVAASR